MNYFQRNKGFIILPRNVMNSPIFKESESFHLFTYLLLRANHKDREVFLKGGKKQFLKRGQLIFGRKQCGLDTGITEKKIRTRIKNFVSDGLIKKQSTSRFSIITICDYDKFQGNNTTLEGQQSTPHGRPSHGQQNGHRMGQGFIDEELEDVATRKASKKAIENDKRRATDNNELDNKKYFDIFWNEYPRKAQFKKTLEEFKKIPMDSSSFKKMMESLRIQKQSEQWENPKYIPNPSNWLKDKRWLDVNPSQIKKRKGMFVV